MRRIENIYAPTEEDILAWAFSPEKKWPAEDWDFYVLVPHNDRLVLKLANDPACPQQEFFLHALYYFVGSTFNRPVVSEERMARIQQLLAMVDGSASAGVVQWKENVRKLMAAELKFDTEMWLHYMFQEPQQ